MSVSEIKNLIVQLSSLLLFMLVLRHWMYYMPLDRIYTEMGFLQPILGIFLIPVTASFGMFFFFARSAPKLSTYMLVRMLLVGCMPVFIAAVRGDVELVFSFGIHDVSRRPSFLILVPIMLAVLVSQLPSVLRSMFCCFGLLIIMTLESISFVLYYGVMFVTFERASTIVHGLVSRLRGSLLLVVFPLYVYASLSVFLFEVPRVSFFHEFFFSVVYLYTLFGFVKLLVPIYKIQSVSISFLKVSLFYFYVSQAVIFNILAASPLSSFPFNSAILISFFVFSVSIFLAKCIGWFEARIVRVFHLTAV